MKRLSTILVLIAVLVTAGAVYAAQPDLVTICHATGSETNPWVEITAAYNAVYGQAGHFSEPGSPNSGHETDYEGPCEVIEPTPLPTDIPPTPTEIPNEPTTEPSAEPTAIPTDGPGPTDIPDVPDPTPTVGPTEPPVVYTDPELPRTGGSPFEFSPNVVWQIEGYDNLVLSHNGTASGLGAEWVQLSVGQIYTLGGFDYQVTGRWRVAADSTYVMSVIREFEGVVLLTCSGFGGINSATGEGIWKYRVLIFLEGLGQ